MHPGRINYTSSPRLRNACLPDRHTGASYTTASMPASPFIRGWARATGDPVPPPPAFQVNAEFTSWMVYRDQLVSCDVEPWIDTQIHLLQREWRRKGIPTTVMNALASDNRLSPQSAAYATLLAHEPHPAVNATPPAHESQQSPTLHSSFDRHLGDAAALRPTADSTRAHNRDATILCPSNTQHQH